MNWHRPVPNRLQHDHRQRGFTLIEGLVVLVIIGIAAAIAIPNLQRVKIKTETQQAVYRIAGYIDIARSEALKRHSPIGLVFGSSSDSNDQWFRIFEDWDPAPPDASTPDLATDGDNALNGNEEVIKRDLLSGKIRILPAPPSGDSDPRSVLFQSGVVTSYKADGSLKVGDGAAYFTDKTGNIFRLRINDVTGVARIEKFLPNKSWSPKKEDWEWYYR